MYTIFHIISDSNCEQMQHFTYSLQQMQHWKLIFAWDEKSFFFIFLCRPQIAFFMIINFRNKYLLKCIMYLLHINNSAMQFDENFIIRLLFCFFNKWSNGIIYCTFNIQCIASEITFDFLYYKLYYKSPTIVSIIHCVLESSYYFLYL